MPWRRHTRASSHRSAVALYSGMTDGATRAATAPCGPRFPPGASLDRLVRSWTPMQASWAASHPGGARVCRKLYMFRQPTTESHGGDRPRSSARAPVGSGEWFARPCGSRAQRPSRCNTPCVVRLRNGELRMWRQPARPVTRTPLLPYLRGDLPRQLAGVTGHRALGAPSPFPAGGGVVEPAISLVPPPGRSAAWRSRVSRREYSKVAGTTVAP